MSRRFLALSMKDGLLLLLILAIQSALAAEEAAAVPDLRIEAGLAGHIRPYLDLAVDPTAERLKKQRAWDPIKQPIPLQPHDAAQLADQWLLKQPKTAFVHSAKNIQLHRCPYPLSDRWFYLIEFMLIQDRQSKTRFAIVLFDGTVIEPKIRE